MGLRAPARCSAVPSGTIAANAVTCFPVFGPIFAGKFQFSGMCDSGRWTRKAMKRSRFTEAQIAFILRQGEEGTAVGEICRKAGISEATYYNWRKKYGGLMPSEMKRLRQLEEENGKLKKIVADLSLDKEMLQDVIRRKL
jgi:putative transposase